MFEDLSGPWVVLDELNIIVTCPAEMDAIEAFQSRADIRRDLGGAVAALEYDGVRVTLERWDI